MLKIKFYLFIIMSVIASSLGLYTHGRKAGERAEQVRNQDVINQSNKEAKRVQESINRVSDDTVRNGMRDNWTRK